VSGNNLTVAASGSNISDSGGRLQRISNNVALASGSTYTISFLMKKMPATGAHTIGGYVAVIDSGGNKVLGGNFDVSGSFSSGITTTTAPVDSRIRRVEQWGTDVYRCSETFRMTASGTLGSLRLGPVVSTTDTSNSAIGTQLAFAAPQIELGALPTSFIPTTAAPVTRNADVINLSGAVSGCIGQTEGAFYMEVDIRSFTNAARIIALSDGTGANTINLQFYVDGGSNYIRASINASSSGQTDIIVLMSAGINKIALGYAQNNVALYLNGTSIGTDPSCIIPATNKIDLGSLNGAAFFNNRIRAAALYTTRLTNDELVALTTL
jgi:hypothetical protein